MRIFFRILSCEDSCSLNTHKIWPNRSTRWGLRSLGRNCFTPIGKGNGESELRWTLILSLFLMLLLLVAGLEGELLSSPLASSLFATKRPVSLRKTQSTPVVTIPNCTSSRSASSKERFLPLRWLAACSCMIFWPTLKSSNNASLAEVAEPRIDIITDYLPLLKVLPLRFRNSNDTILDFDCPVHGALWFSNIETLKS